MPKKPFYNYNPEEIMAADIEKISDKQLFQYAGLHIYINFMAGKPWLAPDPAYERCILEIMRRIPLEKREAMFHGDPLKGEKEIILHYPVIDMYVLEMLGEKQRLTMGRIASRMMEVAPHKRDMEMIPSNLIYQFVQRAIARAPEGIFSMEGAEFPIYSEEKNGFNASVEMRPNENLPARLLPNYHEILASMHQKIDQLGDIAVDVMDIILSRYIRETPENISITTDEILKARGVKPKMKNGYSAGFRPDDRRKISDVLLAMDNLWITVGEMEVFAKGKKAPQRFREKSRLMMITGITEQVALVGDAMPLIWQVRIGKVFSMLLSSDMTTQYALLSSKTLQYDPYHQKWEKRLSRYFHPLWRIRQADGSYSDPIRVKTLLEAIGMPIDQRNPQRTRERFEQALDRLTEDGVLGGWVYEDAQEGDCAQRGWFKRWLDWRVVASPNAQLLALYRASGDMLPSADEPLPLWPVDLNKNPTVDLKAARKRLQITQADLANILGVSRSQIAQIESGARLPSDNFTATFLAWQEEQK